MKIKTKEYEETREFNPTLWMLRKKLFAIRRYLLNILLIFIGIVAFLWFAHSGMVPPSVAFLVAAVFILPGISVRIAFEWERVPILRLGRLYKTKGPGFFFLIIPSEFTVCSSNVV